MDLQQSNLQEVASASEGGCGSDDQHPQQGGQDGGLAGVGANDDGYQIYFEDKLVPATLIQSGVLKATCPGMLLILL